ncbi:MAG: NAD-dependent epimerase/dehydratase family protein, partial [Planctomycetota bacterium]
AFGIADLEQKAVAGAVPEDEHTNPTTMYGCNKLYGEHLGRYYAHHYRQLAQDRVEGLLDFRCLRYPGLISPHTLPSGGTSDYIPEMLHAAAQGTPYACFVREDARIPFMVMPDAIDATLQLAGADVSSLTRSVYNVASFSPSAGEVAELLTKHFPEAKISFAPDVQRQAIVDSWPADVNTQAAEQDWGFLRGCSLEQAFEEVLIPEVRSRYASD